MLAKRLRVLYLEDNPADQQLLQDLLREVPNHGLEIVIKERLQDVLLSTKQGQYDALLLDLNLPDSRGLTTYKALALHYPTLPVIILTVTDLEDVAMSAVRSGAQDYLIKGQLTGALVVRAIRYAVERSSLARDLTQANELLERRIRERTQELDQANKELRSEIEERRLQAQTLLEQRQLQQDILDGLQAAVLFIDVDSFTIVEANAQAEDLLGLTREQIIGQHCYKLICVEKRSSRPESCPVLGKKIHHTDFIIERQDGRFVPVLKSVLPTKLNGKPHLITILFDITERKALERQLVLAQKLEAVGQLAAGIAHEINTPIQYIGGNLSYIEKVIPQLVQVLEAFAALKDAVLSGAAPGPAADDVQQLLEKIKLPDMLEELPQAIADTQDGVQSITDLVRAMKQFSHPQSETKDPVDVNAALQTILTISRNEWKYASTLTTDLAPDLPQVLGFPGKLNQVFLNIIVNAAQANAQRYQGRAEQGTITVTTSHADNQVLVTIADTGVGIPKEYQGKIFDPFFTSKGVGEGTGQGLAIAHAIMQQHGGSISFTSAVGVGTTFTVALPLGTVGDAPGVE
ncbi:MAG: response regulator [Proteobacteria bacterium]|nr:response regulator [Pseudomonadota bacterium]